MRKPEKESFLEVCSQIDVLPEKILFFDDTEENIIAANDLGMHAVKVDSIQDINETIDKLCLIIKLIHSREIFRTSFRS